LVHPQHLIAAALEFVWYQLDGNLESSFRQARANRVKVRGCFGIIRQQRENAHFFGNPQQFGNRLLVKFELEIIGI
jgi:hypothetical protein